MPNSVANAKAPPLWHKFRAAHYRPYNSILPVGVYNLCLLLPRFQPVFLPAESSLILRRFE